MSDIAKALEASALAIASARCSYAAGAEKIAECVARSGACQCARYARLAALALLKELPNTTKTPYPGLKTTKLVTRWTPSRLVEAIEKEEPRWITPQ